MLDRLRFQGFQRKSKFDQFAAAGNGGPKSGSVRRTPGNYWDQAPLGLLLVYHYRPPPAFPSYVNELSADLEVVLL